MDFLTAVHTDVGIRKKTNQDSVILECADIGSGRVLFAAVCDGMGGLAKGEVASAEMVYALEAWFETRLPELLAKEFEPAALHEDWLNMIDRTNRRIADYGMHNNVQLGTTAVVLLVAGGNFYIMNVGDSRAYLVSDALYQLTHDQTYVQQEVDAGRMTPEQALVDPQRSVLLQCVGAGAPVEPEFCMGQLNPGQGFLLCCDGFRHVLSPAEIYAAVSSAPDETAMETALRALTEENKRRGETDHITAVLVRAS